MEGPGVPGSECGGGPGGPERTLEGPGVPGSECGGGPGELEGPGVPGSACGGGFGRAGPTVGRLASPEERGPNLGGETVSSGAVRLADARAIAAAAVEAFRGLGAGVDAEPVGSVRRCRPIVGDVEVLVTGSTPMQIRFALHAIGAERGPPNKRGARAPWGPRYYRAVLPGPGADGHAVGLDVFVVMPPAEWGLLRLIRTGSASFSQAVVTRLHRWDLQAEDGRVVNRSTRAVIPTPTEEAVLRLARLPWIPPSEREMDNPSTYGAFRREAGPGECPDPPGPTLLPVVVPPPDRRPRDSDVPPQVLCPLCGMVHPRGKCPDGGP